MLIHIQSLVLNTGRHAQAVNRLNAKEKQPATHCCPEVNDEYAKALSTEETPAVAVKGSVAR